MSVRPPKLLPIHITSISPAASWTADDGTGDPYLDQPYRWTVTFSVTAQPHSYHLSPTPKYWTGSDIRVGDWIASAPGGVANRIVAIASQSATSLTCTVEDVDRYNTFADSQGAGVGIGPTGAGFCFQLGEDGLPILSPVKPGVLPFEFQVDLLSRFRHRNLFRSYYRVTQAGHTFDVNDPLVLQSDGSYALATDAMAAEAQVVGIVTEAHRHDDATADWFAFKPIGDLIQDIAPPLPGVPGSLIYVGPSGYTDLPPSGTRKPVFIRLETGDKAILLNRGTEVTGTGGAGGGSDAETYAVTVTPSSNTPLTIATVSAGSRVSLVTLDVVTPFDDPTAVLTVGDSGDSDRLMADHHNDLTMAGVYQTTPPYQYNVSTQVKVYFNFGTSTVGEAKVAISYI